MNRREFVGMLVAAAGSMALLPTGVASAASKKSLSADEKTLGQGAWRLSLSEISTANATFKEDIKAYAAAGFDAIGIWEFKLPNDDSVAVALHDARLSVANCVPTVPSILPLQIPGMEG
ncbi:MAG: hypothetical protein ACREQ5_13905, partial [Candidatus Dormibacteria bacterium]